MTRVPPGEILLEALEERGMTQSELARRTARPLKTINEIEVAKVSDLPPFDAGRFRDALIRMRPLTRRAGFQQNLRRIRELCFGAGVVVLAMPEFEGVHLSGVTRWMGGHPVIK
jgi:hypothetical protein